MNVPCCLWRKTKAVLAASVVPNAVGRQPSVRPHALAQVVREYLYAYAAVAPALGQKVSLILLGWVPR